MSYLLRWVRQNQTLAGRSSSLLASTQGNTTASNILISNQTIKPLYQISAAPLTTTSPMLQKGPEQAKKSHGQPTRPGKDDIVYTIKFKDTDYKKIIKDFYSLYGPMFIACHIAVSLCSLGFFCSLVYLTVDLTRLMPEVVLVKFSQQLTEMAGTGGKFVAAYAVHKVLLPVRLVGSIWLTRTLSRLVQARRAAKTK